MFDVSIWFFAKATISISLESVHSMQGQFDEFYQAERANEVFSFSQLIFTRNLACRPLGSCYSTTLLDQCDRSTGIVRIGDGFVVAK